MRLYQIDLFRFIAALSVLLFHYTFRGFAADGLSILEFPELGKIFRYGYLGVDIFFIISGFVIMLSVKNTNLSKFIQSRITRLYPAYWFCLTITFLVILAWGSPVFKATTGQYFINLTMLQRLVGIGHIDWVYWTLLVEIKFYFLIALYLIARSFKNFSINYLIYGWLLLSCLPHLINFQSSVPLKAIYFVLALDYSPCFIAGMLFYKIFSDGNKPVYNAALMACLALSIANGMVYRQELEAYYSTGFSATVITAVIVSFYLFMYLISIKKLNAINSPALLKVGILTYPLYLIHQNIGFILFNNLGHTINKYVLLTATIVFMVAFSYFITRFVEAPLAHFLKNKLSVLFTRAEKS
jgi:peptidoglycan/LPS O-acetylase OafA/YrhL